MLKSETANDNVAFRSNLYAAIPPIATLLVGLGILTDLQGAAVAGLAAEALTLAYAAWNARRGGAPLTRQAIYAALAAFAGVGVAFGVVNEYQVELALPAVMGLVGIVLALVTTQPQDGPGVGADGIPDVPRRSNT